MLGKIRASRNGFTMFSNPACRFSQAPLRSTPTERNDPVITVIKQLTTIEHELQTLLRSLGNPNAPVEPDAIVKTMLSLSGKIQDAVEEYLVSRAARKKGKRDS
jgi:hypothetical protein